MAGTPPAQGRTHRR